MSFWKENQIAKNACPGAKGCHPAMQISTNFNSFETLAFRKLFILSCSIVFRTVDSVRLKNKVKQHDSVVSYTAVVYTLCKFQYGSLL